MTEGPICNNNEENDYCYLCDAPPKDDHAQPLGYRWSAGSDPSLGPEDLARAVRAHASFSTWRGPSPVCACPETTVVHEVIGRS